MKQQLKPGSFITVNNNTLLERLKMLINEYNNFEFKEAKQSTFIEMKLIKKEIYNLVKRLRDEERIRIEPSISFYLKTYTW